MLHHEHSAFIQQTPRSERRKTFRVEFLPLVGRVEEHDIKRRALPLEEIQRFDQFRLDQAKPFAHLEALQVLADDCSRLPRLINEADQSCPPADGFDTDTPHARESIQEACTLHARAQDIEQSFAEFVARGTNAFGRFRLQLTATEDASDNPHHPTVTSPAGVMLLERDDSSFRRRRACSSNSTNFFASFCARARSSESSIRLAIRNSGSPDCRVPAISPGPLKRRSTSARRKPLVVETMASIRSRAVSPILSG